MICNFNCSLQEASAILEFIFDAILSEGNFGGQQKLKSGFHVTSDLRLEGSRFTFVYHSCAHNWLEKLLCRTYGPPGLTAELVALMLVEKILDAW